MFSWPFCCPAEPGNLTVFFYSARWYCLAECCDRFQSCLVRCRYMPQSTHWVTTVAFWRALFLSWWKNLLRLGGGGGVHAHPISVYHHVQSCVPVSSSWEGRYTHPFSSLSLSTLWYMLISTWCLCRMFFEHFLRSFLFLCGGHSRRRFAEIKQCFGFGPPRLDPLVRSVSRIRTKMSRIRNAGF